jgi:hypothetical protein
MFMRARTFAAVLSTTFLVVATPLANSAENRDGMWWNHLTETQKLTYVVGFFDGQIYAERLFDGALLLAQADPTTKLWNPERAKILIEAEKMALKMMTHDFGNVNAGQMSVGLDNIYSDYRNTRIAVTEAIIVVVRSMDGMTSESKIQELLERKRREASP